VQEAKAPFHGDFAFLLFEVPGSDRGETYKAAALLFDENQRIMGEKNLDTFKYQGGPWKNNKLGLDDVVWEGLNRIRADAQGLETIKHRICRFAAGPAGPDLHQTDVRELPLEKRAGRRHATDAELLELGRGPQLRGPLAAGGSGERNSRGGQAGGRAQRDPDGPE